MTEPDRDVAEEPEVEPVEGEEDVELHGGGNKGGLGGGGIKLPIQPPATE